MEALVNYLSETDPDYQAGVTLLATVCKNRNLLNHLRNKENEYTVAKLRFELSRFAERPDLEPLPTVAAQLEQELGEPGAAAPAGDEAPTPSVAENRDKLTPEAAAEVDGIVELQQQLHNRMVKISNGLADLTSDETRLAAVDEQTQLENQYNALAEKKRRILETGQLPTPEAEQEAEAEVVDLAKLKSRQLSLRSTISKNKGKLEKVTTPEKQQLYQVNIAKAEAELNQIALQLAVPTAAAPQPQDEEANA